MNAETFVSQVREHYFDLPTATRVFLQAAAVIVCAITGSIIVGELRFSSPLNLIWMLLLPALIGVFCNRGIINGLFFAYAWVAVSVVTMMLVAGYAGYGPD